MKNSYLPVFFATLLALLATHALLCWYVDPYAIYRDVRVEPVKPYPLDLFYTLRLTKAHQLEQIKPDIVILGSSRAAMLEPLALKDGESIAYNAAMPGLTAREMLAYFRHAVAVRQPRHMLVVLDYDAFVADAAPFRIGFDERRLAVDAADLQMPGRLRRHYADIGNTLFSSSTLRNVVKVLFDKESSGNTYYSDGTWSPNARGRATQPLVEVAYGRMVKQYFDELSAERPVADLACLQSLVAESYDRGIDVAFVIAPVHGMLLTMYGYAGHERARQQWQRDVVQLVEDEARRRGHAPFPVWGFEDNDAIVQPLRVIAEGGEPAFQDGLHMSVAFGRHVLQEVRGRAAGPLYGRRLTGQNMPDYLQSVADRVAAYQRNNPDDIDRIRKKLSLDAPGHPSAP